MDKRKSGGQQREEEHERREGSSMFLLFQIHSIPEPHTNTLSPVHGINISKQGRIMQQLGKSMVLRRTLSVFLNSIDMRLCFSCLSFPRDQHYRKEFPAMMEMFHPSVLSNMVASNHM